MSILLLTASCSNEQPSEDSAVIIGTFSRPNANSMYSGIAEVTPLQGNQYHLSVNIHSGVTHHTGQIEVDFNYDGNNAVYSDEEYQDIQLSFTDHSLTIDYSDNHHFGGMNAEPRGIFYLQNSGHTDAPFLSTLYDELQLDDAYRHGLTDVLSYQLNESSLALLVRSKSHLDSTAVAQQHLVIYDPTLQHFNVLGEIIGFNSPEQHQKLEELKTDPDLIYEILNKDIADRYREVQMQKFDDGEVPNNNWDELQITDVDALYILTGTQGVTRIQDNRRDQHNMGSVFIYEVDHMDDQIVTIHHYELVRNDETDEHTATIQWYEIDRSTGKVTAQF